MSVAQRLDPPAVSLNSRRAAFLADPHRILFRPENEPVDVVATVVSGFAPAVDIEPKPAELFLHLEKFPIPTGGEEIPHQVVYQRPPPLADPETLHHAVVDHSLVPLVDSGMPVFFVSDLSHSNWCARRDSNSDSSA